MKTVQISLNSIDKVKSFVNAITQFEFDFDLISGRYVIDAKSIMGIFSLDLSKPIDLAIHAESNMDEIMEKILADRELYGNGGVILSGGDPLMQPEAATAVLKKCKEHGIRTAIETTAFAKPLAFSRFIANADMIIIDLKHYSEKKYVQFTGVSNHSILENLDFAIAIGKKVAARITITPGINDTLIDARRYAHLLSEHHIRHVILLSYSNLGIIKYEKYTQSPALAREQTFSGQDMENYANMLRGLGFDVQIEQ